MQLSPQERGFYSNMLSLADPLGYNKVGGKDAVNFFKKSGLPIDKLKTVWKMSARSSPEHLSREEFYVALRLIAYLQNGKDATEQAIRINVPVSLPEFNIGAAEKAPLAKQEEPEVKAEDMAAMLPNLDDLDLNQLDGISSLIPS